jgi:two-component system sensor histidine kinase MprB
VRDHVPGITDIDFPHIFDRFYRSINARTAPGSGLGLAIVADAVMRHQGKVFAANAPDGGAIVGFDLPEP